MLILLRSSTHFKVTLPNHHAAESSGSENPLHSEPSSPASPDNKTAANKLEEELAAAEMVASGDIRETVEVDLDDIYGK